MFLVLLFSLIGVVYRNHPFKYSTATCLHNVRVSGVPQTCLFCLFFPSLSLSGISRDLFPRRADFLEVSIRTPNEFRQTGKMPVAGLPTALDSALEALLTENAVSSWKISAEGRKTTVVLRLVTTTDPDMADFTHTATQHFRRKPPSQVRRDQRRAAERTRQNPEASEHSPSGLFQPTPPPTTTVAAHLEMQSENDTQHMYASDRHRRTCFTLS